MFYTNKTTVVEHYFMVYKIKQTFALKCPGLKEILMFFEIMECLADKNWANCYKIKRFKN